MSPDGTILVDTCLYCGQPIYRLPIIDASPYRYSHGKPVAGAIIRVNVPQRPQANDFVTDELIMAFRRIHGLTFKDHTP